MAGRSRMTKESLEEKIIKAEERVVRTGKTYNDACEELEDLRKARMWMPGRYGKYRLNR